MPNSKNVFLFTTLIKPSTRLKRQNEAFSTRGLPHLHVVEDFEEGEGHPATDDHLVHLIQHVVDQLDLIFHLRSESTMPQTKYGYGARDLLRCHSLNAHPPRMARKGLWGFSRAMAK